MTKQPRIGILWGDFTQSTPAKFGKLWSMGKVAHHVTKALQSCGQVVPFCQPSDWPATSSDDTDQKLRTQMLEFLQGIDILWADLYPASAFALTLRAELNLSCTAILFAGGVMPKGAEAMLFPWQQLLRPTDGILFTSVADQAIWKRLTTQSYLREW